MKLKELFYGLHLKPRTREYGFDICRYQLAKDGEVYYANWRHPKEQPKRFDQSYVDALREFLKPGDYALDIGAHSGDTTLPMALAVGPKGGIFALEPNPYVFKVLLANAGLNRTKTNIYPLMFAATAEDGEYEFEYSDPGFCNGGLHEGISHWRHAHFFKLKVQGRDTLTYIRREFPDALARIRYIKIDAEGYDRAITRSLRELVVANRPYIRTEIYKHLSLDERLGYFHDLRELGYIWYRLEDEKNYRGQRIEETNLMAWPHYDVFAVPA